MFARFGDQRFLSSEVPVRLIAIDNDRSTHGVGTDPSIGQDRITRRRTAGTAARRATAERDSSTTTDRHRRRSRAIQATAVSAATDNAPMSANA